MQQCQDRLEFQIETPSDKQLAKRFAELQRKMDDADGVVQKPQANVAKNGHKTRNRKSKKQKKQERMNRAIIAKRSKSWEAMKDAILNGEVTV